jgi:hypothetical protein
VRSATAARAALGSTCLVAPGPVLEVIGGPDMDDPATQLVVQVLGGRLLLQAAADLALGRRTRRFDVLVDLTHAASMLPVAARWPSHRRAALVSAAAATAIALLDLWSAGG